MSLSTPNIIPEDGGLPKDDSCSRPRKSELPWDRRPWFLIFNVSFILMLAAFMLVFQWERGVRWFLFSLIVFILGAGAGLTCLPMMIRFHERSWPLRKLTQEFSRNRFLSFPTFSPAFLRMVQQFNLKQAEKGLPQTPGRKENLLVGLPLILAVCIGYAARIWIDWPRGFAFPALAFCGVMLTWAFLPLFLWVRSLQD